MIQTVCLEVCRMRRVYVPLRMMRLTEPDEPHLLGVVPVYDDEEAAAQVANGQPVLVLWMPDTKEGTVQ